MPTAPCCRSASPLLAAGGGAAGTIGFAPQRQAAAGAGAMRSSLQSGIGGLPPRLAVLSLCFNEIEALPAHLVTALPLLQELDLTFNRWAG